MSLYRFKILFEDFDDIYRVIEIHSHANFFDFHNAIQESIGFDKSQLASFYLSDDNWKKGFEITLESMQSPEDLADEAVLPIPIMKDARLCDYIDDPHQKFVYVFDFINMWTFHIELTGINLSENPRTQYPFCVKSVGVPPKQYVDKRFTLVDDDEFEELTESYLSDHEDELDDEEQEDLLKDNLNEEGDTEENSGEEII